MFSFDRYHACSTDELRKLVKANPTSLDFRFSLGLKLMDEEKFDLAKKEFETVLELDPEHADSAFYLGISNFRLEHYMEANIAFRKLPDTYLQSHAKWEYLGEIHRKWKEYELAREFYFEALRSGGAKSPVVHRGLTELSLEGTPKLGFEVKGRILVSDQLYVEKFGRKVHATLRIFCDLKDRNRRIVLLSSDSGNTRRHPGDIGVTNGAEVLIEKVLSTAMYGLTVEDTTFYFMHEDGGWGIPAMNLTSVSFDMEILVEPLPSFRDRVRSFLYETSESKPPKQRVANLKFRGVSHPRFEERTGFRLFWEPES